MALEVWLKKVNNLKLTICIPSFDRLSKAKDTIKTLIPQVYGRDIKILILDNASPVDYFSDFSSDPDLFKAIEDGYLMIHRNQVNLGMSANFLRAFEVVESDWLWLLSDDDEVDQQAVNTLLSAIHLYGEEYGFIKFSSIRSRPPTSEFKISSLEEFIKFNSRSANDFNGFIFISNGVYKVRQFKSFISVGYQHAHTYIPHFMMITAFIADGGKAAMVDKEIVRYVVPKVGYSYGLVAGLGVGGIKSLMLKLTPRQMRDFYSIFFPHNDFKVIIDLYFLCKTSGTPVMFNYLVRNYICLVSIARSLARLILLRLIICLCRFPFVFESLLSFVEKRSQVFNMHISEIKSRYVSLAKKGSDE